MWSPQRCGRALTDRIDRPDREGKAEQVPCKLGHVATRNPVTRSHRHDRGLQVGAERRVTYSRRELDRRALATTPPAKAVRAMLAVDHRDRGNSATWWRPKRPEDSRSSPENSRHSPRRRRGSARRSHQADPRGAACERTPLCPGWAPALRFSPSRLAHCLAFSRAAARRSAREVGGSLRGRTRRIARVLAQFLLKPRHALCQPDDLALITCRQLKQKLDARPPPRVIDRFRLGALHTPKIRPPRPRSLQQAPQMNAYQKP